MQEVKKYNYPIALTNQFKHCGNAFRIDTYKGCSFGCKYCFANNRGGDYDSCFAVADINEIKKIFQKAFDSGKESRNITIELLRHKVPLHLGGMSDPFQSCEKFYKVTYDFLTLSNKYNYPVLISTKQAFLEKEYWNILNPKIHAFQISLFSDDEERIKRFEKNTPTASDRICFMKELKKHGFWVGLRLQPLITIEDAIGVITACGNNIDYITVEHLKIPTDNKRAQMELFDLTGRTKNEYKKIGKDYQLPFEIKKKNIDTIKSITNIPIGCGDNDLHEYSDSYNCCGIDTIGESFNNWIKYNQMYIKKTGDKNVWFPKSNCSSCMNSECRTNGYIYTDYVDKYICK